MPLWLQILLAVVGLGVLKALLDYCTKLSELYKWLISILILIALVAAANSYAHWLNRPRRLSGADENRLAQAFKGVALPPFQVRAPWDPEAQQYGNDFVSTFNRIGLTATGTFLAIQTSPNDDVGMCVYVHDKNHPPPAATTFIDAMRVARFPAPYCGEPSAIAGANSFPGDFTLMIASRH